MLLQIDAYYNELIQKQNDIVKKQEELENELERIKVMRGVVVMDFIYVHKCLGLKEKPLTFISDKNTFTEIRILDGERINYEKYPITYNFDK